jgi:hypothetical protein
MNARNMKTPPNAIITVSRTRVFREEREHKL